MPFRNWTLRIPFALTVAVFVLAGDVIRDLFSHSVWLPSTSPVDSGSLADNDSSSGTLSLPPLQQWDQMPGYLDSEAVETAVPLRNPRPQNVARTAGQQPAGQPYDEPLPVPRGIPDILTDEPIIPDPIEPPRNASPIKPGQQRVIAEEILAEEMPGIPADERDVLLEELEQMPVSRMREHLEIWKRFSVSRPLWLRSPTTESHPATGDKSADVDADTGISELPGHVWLEPRIDAFGPIAPRNAPEVSSQKGLALAVSRRNLEHAEAIGFKALKLIILESNSASIGVESVPEILIQRDMSQGKIRRTGRFLDLAIEGEGFLQVEREGKPCFTRTGHFSRTGDGEVVLRLDGKQYRLIPRITLNPGQSFSVSASGQIRYLPPNSLPGESRDSRTRPEHESGSSSVDGARLMLSLFPNPEGLEWEGGLAFATPDSGEAKEYTPGADGAGVVLQAALELSNVSVMDEVLRQQRLHLLQKMQSFRPGDLDLPDREARIVLP